MVRSDMDLTKEEIVIAGISGKFPESKNIQEFWENLYNGVDMVTDVTDRWNVEMYDIPRRMGQLGGLEKFDAEFLGVHGKQADVMDPRLRFLLELTHEAIIDAGVNPVSLRGSKTGVYVGAGGEEVVDYHRRVTDNPSGYCATGGTMSMLSNRISFTYNLQGPSMTLDTACSSSLLALQQALTAIRTGLCDSAIVAGVHLCIDPMTTVTFTNLGLTSKEGKCKSFDASGDGYVRSEAAVVLYICKKDVARRSYATLVHGKTNADGYKTQGITFPSGLIQEKLLREVYSEAGINPKDVDYVEAHGTGTRAGDPEEVNAITRVFCEGRDPSQPLLMGSVKSNMGHSEPASGLCGIAKLVLANQHGVLPANLHYSTPNPDIPALIDGRIKVVTENTDFSHGSLVAVNSFGFGGANVHILLRFTPRKEEVEWKPEIPVIIPFSGRTPEIESSLEQLMSVKDRELVKLLHDVALHPIPGHPHRGFAITNESQEIQIKTEELQQVWEKRPLWFVFSGMGTQYVGMVRDMMIFKTFRESIKRSGAILKENNFDLDQVIYTEDPSTLEDGLNSIVAVTAVQVALIDLLSSVGIVPDKIFGHSLGEVACTYSDGCLTAEQTVLVSLARGRAFNKAKIPGAMASVGLTWEDAEKRCPENVFPACHNSKDNVTISGPTDLVQAFVKELQDEGVFARNVHSSGFAFHSIYMGPTEPHMRELLPPIVPVPKERTPRWISTSVPESKKDTDLDKYCSVDYLVNNALAPVRFHEVSQLVPDNAILVEVAPHCLMQAILKRSLPKGVSMIGVMNKNVPNNAMQFLNALGQLYLAGCNPDFGALYESVEFPVCPSTPMISSAIHWDHSDNWVVPIFKGDKASSGGSRIPISLTNEADSFYAGHTIDGRIIYPATGYMWLVWSTFAKSRGMKFEQCPVVFENLRFERNTMLPPTGGVEFSVSIFPDSGDFEVFEQDSAVFRGKIREFNPKLASVSTFESEICTKELKEGILNRDDFYKELRLRGYEYQGPFRGVKAVDINGESGEIEWQNNWIGFLDTLLQISLTQQPNRGLYLPIRLQRAVIDPATFLEFEKNNQDGIPVTYLKQVRAIKVPGVELCGLKVAIAPRRKNQIVPTLMTQRFVPYLDTVSDLSPQHCVEFCLEIVMDNTLGRKFMMTEFCANIETCWSPLIVPLFSVKFEHPDLFVVSEVKSEKVEEQGIKIIAPTETKLAENSTLVIAEETSLSPASELVAPNGFLLLRGSLPDFPGFKLIAQKPDLSLFRKYEAEEAEETPMVIIKAENEKFEWVEELKAKISSPEKIILVSESSASGMQGFVQCLLRENYSNVRSYHIKEGNIFDFARPSEELSKQLNLDLFYNVYESGTWGTYCNLSCSTEELEAPQKVPHAFVNALQPGDLSSLQWIESSLVIPQETNNNDLCKVNYSSLNFRDIMLATGKLSRDALPGDLAFQECVLGIEFSGTRNGKPICGMQAAKCLATSIKLDDSGFLWEVPGSWSLAEAATVPVAYGTAYYALLVRGRMRRGETVLIHAGSGGVGQAAIAIALSRKCRVITTVSTPEKRQFLQDRFPQLTNECFTDSRNALRFEKHVMEQTNGRGVDIVLNSLAQDKLEASVRCLAKYGRFLEIGKFDLFNNSALGMEIFLKSVNFQGILLDDVIQSASEDREEVAELIRAGIESGVVQPLPHTLFSHDQLEEAFRFMATGKHMGKVVVKIQEETETLSEVPAIPRTYFYHDKVYVLVGGLGGMGLEIGNWMVSRGARKLVFVSRSGITTGYQEYRVKIWRDQGASIVIDDSDVTSEDGVRSLLVKACQLGQIGGIFNLALVLNDAMFKNQTPEHFEIVSKAKINATKHLDKLSRTYAPDMDYFVVFSSLASAKGNAGQTNYGFANAFMERVCEERREAGFHGLAVQWGAIGDVGVLHKLLGGKDIPVAGVAPQRITSCLEILDLVLKSPHPVISSFIPASKIANKDLGSKSLVELVAHILAIKDVSKVNKKATFVELGMDSLMATEIKQVLESKKNITLPVTAFPNLTFEKIMEMEKGEGGTRPDESEAEFEFKQYQLLPMPKEPLIKMETKVTESSKTLFVVHPLDGNVFLLERLMAEVEMPVYGFQCVKEAPLDSISSLAAFYIQNMKKVQKAGPYYLAGYSYGAAVAFEMTLLLEREGETVENLILLDGCHTWPRFFTKAFIEREVEKDDSAWLIYFLFLHMSLNQKKVEKEFAALPDWNARLLKTSEMLHQVFPTLPVEEIQDLASLYASRLSAGYAYEPSGKVKSSVTLVRAGQAGFDRYLGNDYGLDQVCENPVEVFAIAGHHHCFHDRPVELGVPKIINDKFL